MAQSKPVDSSSLPKKDAITVVIAMDGSEYSEYALDFYMQCLHRPGNKVLISHNTEIRIVSNPAVAIMTGGTDLTILTKEIKAEAARTAELTEKLKQKVKDLKVLVYNSADSKLDPGAAIFLQDLQSAWEVKVFLIKQDDCTIENIHGETGPSIVTFATNNKADYIVVGCRGTGKFRKTFTGSVSDYITQHSHVPVLVARNIDPLEKLHNHMHHK